jgi:hypothetical protein
MTTASKNKLSQCRTRDALFNVLAIECEGLGFDYDMMQSMRKNSARARERMMWSVAEVINFAERVESSL